jgi:para-nitrobenzyl esterase
MLRGLSIALAAATALWTSGTGHSAQTEHPAPVHTEYGWVEGVRAGDLTIYKGIRFGASTAGEGRWRPPAPPKRWKGVVKADHFAPGCMQIFFPSTVVRPRPRYPRSEDCLFLNVWTPAKGADDRLAVMVWIYGGGFDIGNTETPVFDGAALARKGVVVVSIAYRVGLLGFLAHPGLSDESPHHVSGNYGLLDQIAALEWVRRNIAAFGGDARRVTIFGQSAGGISTSILAASPLAKGLFARVISQSGGNFGPPSTSGSRYPGENLTRLHDAEQAGAALMARLGATTPRQMRSLPAEAILRADKFDTAPTWPTLDGYVIPSDQYLLYAAGKQNDTPILVGFTSDDGGGRPQSKLQDFRQYLQRRFGPFAERIESAYPASDDAEVRRASQDLSRDVAFGWHEWTWARLQSRTGRGRAFVYYFSKRPPYPDLPAFKGLGAIHTAEEPYMFDNLVLEGYRYTAADRALAEEMSSYWVNFAKTGDPNGAELPEWPNFTEAAPMAMLIGDTSRAGRLPDEGGLKVLDAYFAWRRTPPGSR